jgi:transcription initiation factor TFIIF subunit alpha
MAQFAKQKNPEQWLAHRTKAGADSSGSGIKSEEIANPHIPATASLVHSSSQGLGPGGRKLKSVDIGMNGLFGDNDDDDEVDFKRKREREFGADGDGDEIDFEEDFADDEEKNPDEAEDDEAKELEVCLKICIAV